MLSPQVKRNLLRIIPFGIIWLVSGIVFLIVEQVATIGNTSSPGVIDMSLEVLLFSSLAITAVGLGVGFIELRYLDKLFLKQSFPKKILYKLIIYFLLLMIITTLTYPIAASMELETNILDPKVWDKFYEYLVSLTHLSTNLQLGVALVLSLLYSEISENIGNGILLNFFTGKYHRPTQEQRIFMFMDMKSSTTIAEKLGNTKYFELLREYYFDLSEPIVRFSGEIYQYVGDEIVVSWKLNNGLEKANCINCFYAMKKSLASRSDFYIKNFGVIPVFKAGFHQGEVTIGEIGALKKEIIFTGDVLNTTARIQSLCNPFDQEILLSEDLVRCLKPHSDFQFLSLGTNKLKGKTENLELFTLLIS